MKFTKPKALTAALVAGVLTLSLSACTGGPKPAPTPVKTPRPLVQIDKVTGQTTQIALSSGFTSALKKLRITPAADGQAVLGNVTGGTGFTFPITGGSITYYDPAKAANLPGGYVQGNLLHSGSGITLRSGRTTVALRDFVVVPNSGSRVVGDVYVNNKSVANDVELFRLAGGSLKPLTQDGAGNAVLAGSGVYVAAPAAKLLDDTFKTKAITDQTRVGVARITLTLPRANGGQPSTAPSKKN